MFWSIRAARRMALAGAIIAGGAALAMTLIVPAATAPAATSAPAEAPARSLAPAGRAPARSVAARIPLCTAADLGVWVALDQGGAAAGTLYYPLEFTDLSHQACTLYGFPGLSAIGGNGQQLGSPASWDHSVAARTVRLAPGGTAYALLEYSDVVTGNCPGTSKGTAAELRVYPPGRTRADYSFWDLATCSARGLSAFLRVRAIAPGIGVRGDQG
jgi:hypothetical protein